MSNYVTAPAGFAIPAEPLYDLFERKPMSEADALDYLVDAAFIAGTLGATEVTSVFDHHQATDYLQWAAERYGEAVTGELVDDHPIQTWHFRLGPPVKVDHVDPEMFQTPRGGIRYLTSTSSEDGDPAGADQQADDDQDDAEQDRAAEQHDDAGDHQDDGDDPQEAHAGSLPAPPSGHTRTTIWRGAVL